MARSLPENTVDAWTAIELARCGVSWIWLPTANQGGTGRGAHPGDVSAMAGRRLVVIENKAVVDESKISFGSDGGQQRSFLRSVEELAVGLLPPDEIPALGWVFYGLPVPDGPIDGSDWSEFPMWHELACPHTVDDIWRIGETSVQLSKLRRLDRRHVANHDRRARYGLHLLMVPFTLDRLRYAMRRGRAGLPLGDSTRVLGLLQSLVNASRQLSDLAPDDDLEYDNASHLVGAFGRMVASGAAHPAVVVL